MAHTDYQQRTAGAAAPEAGCWRLWSHGDGADRRRDREMRYRITVNLACLSFLIFSASTTTARGAHRTHCTASCAGRGRERGQRQGRCVGARACTWRWGTTPSCLGRLVAERRHGTWHAATAKGFARESGASVRLRRASQQSERFFRPGVQHAPRASCHACTHDSRWLPVTPSQPLESTTRT